tara:strand:+ start:320 stop:1285 length:966 start_codon:yes stop_codon:yes gene_type:complete
MRRVWLFCVAMFTLFACVQKGVKRGLIGDVNALQGHVLLDVVIVEEQPQLSAEFEVFVGSTVVRCPDEEFAVAFSMEKQSEFIGKSLDGCEVFLAEFVILSQGNSFTYRPSGADFRGNDVFIDSELMDGPLGGVLVSKEVRRSMECGSECQLGYLQVTFSYSELLAEHLQVKLPHIDAPLCDATAQLLCADSTYHLEVAVGPCDLAESLDSYTIALSTLDVDFSKAQEMLASESLSFGEDIMGKLIFREGEELFDTVWLATSPRLTLIIKDNFTGLITVKTIAVEDNTNLYELGETSRQAFPGQHAPPSICGRAKPKQSAQ